ncbi:MAG: cupin domain-containing protein [Mycobacterium kyogaense]|uniref:cupin domain-containing protein n=1 Tax=Mycobacterium kyogaense TaxID=2212479 RepID=UPI002FFAFE71
MTETRSPAMQRVPTGDAAREAMSPCAYITAESLRTGAPDEHDLVHLSSSDAKFTVGSWRAEPYSEYIDAYPGDEYALVLEGSVTLSGDDGVTQTFSAGDAYVMRSGWRGEFRVTETLTKQFALYIP